MIDTVIQAIAEPHRREILQILQEGEYTAGDIASHFEVSRPAISQHLKVLTTAELITVRKDGTRRMYQIRRDGLLELREFLGQFWDDHLQLLKQAAEEEERRI